MKRHISKQYKRQAEIEKLFPSLPEGFAAEAAKLGLDPSGPKYPYPVIRLGPDSPSHACYAPDWRLSAPPESEAYKEAIENPKDEFDDSFKKSLETIVDMGLFPYTL